MISGKIPAGGFQTIFEFSERLRGRCALKNLESWSSADPSFFSGFRKAAAPRLLLLAGAMAMAAIGFGCNDYNPNLGAAPTQTSSLSLLNPGSRPAGAAGDFTLTINGQGFVTGSTAVWNNGNQATPLVTSLANISNTLLTAAVPAALVAQPGTITVDVTSPPPAGSTPAQNQGNNVSNYVPFCVVPPVAAVTSLSPTSVNAGGAAFTLTVNGTGFLDKSVANNFGGSVVLWANTARATTFVSATQLKAQITAADIASGGTSVQVSMELDPGACARPSKSLTFQINPAPANVSGTGHAVTGVSSAAATNFTPAITSGPRFVAFAALSADPATDAGVGVNRIFVRDTCIGTPAGCTPQTSVVSVGLAGAAPDADSRSPSISADGRFVAFASDADNLVLGDRNGLTDIFVRDTCTGVSAGCTPATTRVSVAADGTEANGASDSPSISADGRYIAFDSQATNLTPGSSGAVSGSTSMFVRDTCFGATGACTPGTTVLPTSSAAPQQ